MTSSCCSSSAAGKCFNSYSDSYARKFKKGKLERVQRKILAALKPEDVGGKQLLDIGCGVGALHLTLLRNGASSAVGVDLAEGMIRQAERYAEEFGVREKTEYIVGDFAQLADGISKADVALLDKVVCCYEDLPTLVNKVSGKTRSVVALSHPRDRWYMRFSFWALKLIARFSRDGFAPFWHDWDRMRAMIEREGFVLDASDRTLMWNVQVYRRRNEG